MNKNVRIAKQLLKIAKSLIAGDNDRFDFTKVNEDVSKCVDKDKDKYGPEHIFKVIKVEGVYAHKITEEDVEKIEEASSKEGKYDKQYEDYKKVDNWIAADPKLTSKGGKFWLIKKDKFNQKYQDNNPDETKKITETFCDNDFEFIYYPPNAEEQYCFRLPSKGVPSTMYLGGNKFEPGEYVFINGDGKCDVWARSVDSMANYDTVDDKNYSSQFNIKEDYKQLISGEKD